MFIILSKPKYGWTDFSLQGSKTYSLSYLDDIGFEWIDRAIHGLETMSPFCVKGFLEPTRLLCIVSYWNCHIIIEDDDRCPLNKEYVTHEVCHISMIEFCKCLYEDVNINIEEWTTFVSYNECNIKSKKKTLIKKLNRLKELISEKEKHFGENCCFL